MSSPDITSDLWFNQSTAKQPPVLIPGSLLCFWLQLKAARVQPVTLVPDFEKNLGTG